MNTIIFFFCLCNIELRCQKTIVLHWLWGFWQQVGEKFIPTFLSSFLWFSPLFNVHLYIPWVLYGNVWSLKGSFHICILVKLDLFHCLASDRKSPPQRKETLLIIFGKEVDLARNLFHKQCIYHQKSINIQQSFRLGRRATLYREGLINKQEGGF